MINKLDLTSVISKYHLNGMIEPVKWDIKDETLTIKFNAPTKDMIGKVVFKGMPLDRSQRSAPLALGLADLAPLAVQPRPASDAASTLAVFQLCLPNGASCAEWSRGGAGPPALDCRKLGQRRFDRSAAGSPHRITHGLLAVNPSQYG